MKVINISLNQKTITFVSNVTNIFSTFKDHKVENGGIILGQVNTKESTVWINRASVPSFKDKRSKYSFNRNKKWAQSIVDYEYYNTMVRTVSDN